MIFVFDSAVAALYGPLGVHGCVLLRGLRLLARNIVMQISAPCYQCRSVELDEESLSATLAGEPNSCELGRVEQRVSNVEWKWGEEDRNGQFMGSSYPAAADVR